MLWSDQNVLWNSFQIICNEYTNGTICLVKQVVQYDYILHNTRCKHVIHGKFPNKFVFFLRGFFTFNRLKGNSACCLDCSSRHCNLHPIAIMAFLNECFSILIRFSSLIFAWPFAICHILWVQSLSTNVLHLFHFLISRNYDILLTLADVTHEMKVKSNLILDPRFANGFHWRQIDE